MGRVWCAGQRNALLAALREVSLCLAQVCSTSFCCSQRFTSVSTLMPRSWACASRAVSSSGSMGTAHAISKSTSGRLVSCSLKSCASQNSPIASRLLAWEILLFLFATMMFGKQFVFNFGRASNRIDPHGIKYSTDLTRMCRKFLFFYPFIAENRPALRGQESRNRPGRGIISDQFPPVRIRLTHSWKSPYFYPR